MSSGTLVCTWCRSLIMGDDQAVHMHVPRIVWQQHLDLVFHPACFERFCAGARCMPATIIASELTSSRPKLEEYPSMSEAC